MNQAPIDPARAVRGVRPYIAAWIKFWWVAFAVRRALPDRLQRQRQMAIP